MTGRSGAVRHRPHLSSVGTVNAMPRPFRSVRRLAAVLLVAAVGSSAAPAVSAASSPSGLRAIYPAAPGSIVVAINAGHGDPDPGAVHGGYREADLNLKIAKRLRRMLEAAGVSVVMIRTSDTHANVPAVDRDGDGDIDHDDELIARIDIANEARPDLDVTVMNNAFSDPSVRGTETFTSEVRSWTPEGVALAKAIQAAHLRRLAAFATPSWQPIDRGVKFHPFSSMEPYSKHMPRPTLMPSVLVELLFMSNPTELGVLVKPSVLTALTAAYYDGIARWLNHRAYGLRYDLSNVPTSAPAGGTAAVDLHLTNRGNRSSKGWVLEARIVPAVPYYDGSPVRGTLVAQTPLSDGLAPGASLDVSMPDIPMPASNGEWLVKFDVRLPGGGSLGDHGVVGPQIRITTDGAAPTSAGAAPAAASGSAGLAAGLWNVALPQDPLRGVPGPGGARQPTGLESWWACVVRQSDIPADSPAGTWGVDHFDH